MSLRAFPEQSATGPGTNVVDHTGLSGMYAYHLMWNWSTRPPQDDEERYPNIPDAVREQLGLELKETKGPVTFWVIDHIERPRRTRRVSRVIR